MKKRDPKRYLGIPYNWHPPTWSQVKKGVWNANDRRVFVPKIFGWGYAINFYELLRRLGLIRRR